MYEQMMAVATSHHYVPSLKKVVEIIVSSFPGLLGMTGSSESTMHCVDDRIVFHDK